ncbi:MAG: hypothetical protein JJ964_08250 [Rhizobiales bacterium]|nr:hypothetical protein [Hyphomicrobiales bacterium]
MKSVNNDIVIKRIRERLHEVYMTNDFLISSVPIDNKQLETYMTGKKVMPPKIVKRIADMLCVDVKWLRGQQENKC